MIRRYSRLALPTVVVILASGVVSAFAELGSVHSAFSTGYGQMLVVKTALVLAALTVAAATRLLTLPTGPGIELPLLRRLTLSESALVIAVLAAAGLLVNLAPPRTTTAAAGALGPPPLNGPALRVAGFAGRTGVGLAASDEELQFTIVPPPGRAASGYRLTANVRGPDGKGADLYPRPCGSGCFSIRYPLQAGTTRVTARVSSPGSPAAFVHFDVAGRIAAARPELLARVVKAMRAIPSVDVTEQLADGSRDLGGPTTYRLAGSGFVSGEAFSTGAVDVRVAGRDRQLTELTLAARDSTAWYRLWVDGAFHVQREEIVSPGLLIRRTFDYLHSGAIASAAVAQRAIPTGPFVTALEDGDLAVAFAAQPAGIGRLKLTVTVIGPDGDGAAGLRVAVALESATGLHGTAVPCGAGCYQVTLPFAGTPRVGAVTIKRLGHVPSAVHFDFPPSWPPPPAEKLAREATSVFSGLSSVTIDERLGSSQTDIVHTHWRLEAPNRLTYAIEGGSQAVIIGDRRWDRDPGQGWAESPQSPVRQPTSTWASAPGRAALLGSGRVNGREVWRISFVKPDVPAWFTIAVDKQTLRTLELRMVAPAHFMHHVYDNFNELPAIRPPG